MSFSSLASVELLIQNRYMLLAGGVHYRGYDLFVGSWEVRDAQQIGIAHCLVIPCLIFNFIFGSASWLLYFAIRSVAIKSVGIEGTGSMLEACLSIRTACRGASEEFLSNVLNQFFVVF